MEMSAMTRFERLDDLFPEMFRRFAQPSRLAAELPGDIRIDLSENEKEYLVSAEIPGAKKDDIRVVVDGNFVSISAEVKKEIEDKHADDGRSLLKETYRGAIQRSFTLAHDVDDKAAVAKLDNGMLRLTLPKRTGATSRLLTIE
jgi:HSP20 family protein